MVQSGNERPIEFPEGFDWVYYFDPTKIYQGGTTQTLQIPINEFPAFHRQGFNS